MATLKEDSDSWSAGGIIRRDFQQDRSGPEEMPHKKKKGKAKPSPKKKPGCPGNEGKSHIYVWIKYTFADRLNYYNGNSKCVKKCLGCSRTGDAPWRFIPDDSEIYETRHIDSWWDVYRARL